MAMFPKVYRPRGGVQYIERHKDAPAFSAAASASNPAFNKLGLGKYGKGGSLGMRVLEGMDVAGNLTGQYGTDPMSSAIQRRRRLLSQPGGEFTHLESTMFGRD